MSPSDRLSAAVLLSLSLFAGAARASTEAQEAPREPGVMGVIESPVSRVEAPGLKAVRTSARIGMDGTLDEEAWRSAPVFERFVQSYPKSGEAPTERTEVRIVYDDDTIYFGITCHDSSPQLINGRLGRRDRMPFSDTVSVEIDSRHDHRTGYVFQVNAGGVLQDGVLFEDNQFSADWDGTWEGVARQHPGGWSAELAIPLRLLRFPSAAQQTWGVAVRREISRSHERIDSVLIPNDSSSRVSLFGHLSGLENLQERAKVSLVPFLATRTALRPQYSDPSRPTPRLFTPSLDVGLDLNAALTSNLTLTATVNPDFGQVEADRLILNFSNFEAFFPEKRPFFTQGMDLFQPVGAQSGRSPQMLFYTRRMGLDAPILGATKVTGTIAPGWEVGLVDVLVAGAADPSKLRARHNGLPLDEDRPDGRFQFHALRPFHLGPNHELPEATPTTRNYLAIVTRGKVDTLTLGASLTDARPFSLGCQELPESERPEGEADCTPAGGSAAAVDWNLRSRDGEWGFLGQLSGSRASGSRGSARILQDGTTLNPGDLGAGTYMRAGKFGGEPWRFQLAYEHNSPRLELNATGFQRTQNEQMLSGSYAFVRPSGLGKLLEFSTTLGATSRWSTDGRMVPRGTGVTLGSEAVLPDFYSVGCEAGFDFLRNDIREIDVTGLPFERPNYGSLTCYGGTDTNKSLSLNALAFLGQTFSTGASPSKGGFGAEVGAIWSPHSRLETELIATLDADIDGPRWVGDSEPGRSLFAELNSNTLSFTLRQILVITPQLTLQAYAQVFSGYGHYGPFYEASTAGVSRVRLADLRPTTSGLEDLDPSFHVSAVNVNVVSRWEFRPGSTLYLVYSRAQEEAPLSPFVRPTQPLVPIELLRGPATDLLMLKFSYQWDA